MRSTDYMREEYTIETPENVSFGYEVAGIGNRFVGALIDVLILGVVLMLLSTLTGVVLGITEGFANITLDRDELSWAGGLVLAVSTLVNFLLIWGYFAIFELVWNGQTPGKRVARTQVIRSDGSAVGFLGVAVRNLVRIVDFLPGGYLVGLVTMLLNRRARRLGDFAAGTLVVRLADGKRDGARPSARTSSRAANVSLNDVLAARAASPTANKAVDELNPSASTTENDEWLLRFPYIRRLTMADYELIQSTLERERTGSVPLSLLRRLTDALSAKLEVEPPPQSRRFLHDVAEAYRRHGR